MNNPQIKLLSINPELRNMFSLVWEIAKSDTPVEDIIPLIKEAYDRNLSADLPPQEYVHMVWLIEGMPRAFWDQLDRCRLAVFWEQSARVLDLREFAERGRYWIPEVVAQNEEALHVYRRAMFLAQRAYKALVEIGIPSEEARGVIPLHIITRGTFAINLRALRGLLRNRACFVCQGSYWLPVITGMLRELKPYLPPQTLRSLVQLPCYGCDKCPIEGSVVQRIAGEDPNPVCPIFIERFAKDKKEVRDQEIKRHPEYPELEKQYLEFLDSMGLLRGGESSESR